MDHWELKDRKAFFSLSFPLKNMLISHLSSEINVYIYMFSQNTLGGLAFSLFILCANRVDTYKRVNSIEHRRASCASKHAQD